MSTNEQTMAKEEFEAYQRTLRAAFYDGWRAGEEHRRGRTGIATDAEVEAEARKEYPIRTTKGERVAMNGGWLFFDADGHLRWESEEGHFGHTIAPYALEHLRANPFEEVES